MKTAIYAGSFDPFTNGHYDIFKQANKLFDMIYLVFSRNYTKKRNCEINYMAKVVKYYLQEQDIDSRKGYEVIISDKLISDLAKELNTTYLIRGCKQLTINYKKL